MQMAYLKILCASKSPEQKAREEKERQKHMIVHAIIKALFH